MSQPKNFIEINGRKYHAQTGQLINDAVAISVDAIKPAAKPHKPSHATRSVKHAKPKSTQKSTTLMRPAVKKPEHKAPVRHSNPAPPPIKHVPEDRARRAGQVKKSPHINRFSSSAVKPDIIKRHAELPVVHQKPAPQPEENSLQETVHKSVDQFEQVIHDATSHLETYAEEHKPKNFRKLAFATASLSVVLLAGFVIYQAVPTVKVKVASDKAGFSADLPNYSPAGYGLSSDIASSSGQVTLAYNSRTDDKSYKVQQQPSNWNSQSLVNNFLLAQNKPYQTYENNGKTVYLYEETNATWVDGGVWYRIEGDASLTSDQLLRIANGL